VKDGVEGRDDPGAGRTERMAQGDCSTEDIQPVVMQVQLTLVSESNG